MQAFTEGVHSSNAQQNSGVTFENLQDLRVQQKSQRETGGTLNESRFYMPNEVQLEINVVTRTVEINIQHLIRMN